MFDLKRLRRDFNLTQVEIAFILGCGQPNIVAIEKNNKELQPNQIKILEEKFGSIDKYFVDDIEIENRKNSARKGNLTPYTQTEIDKWDELVQKQQETIEKLLSILESEKKEKAKLIDTIDSLSKMLIERKAV